MPEQLLLEPPLVQRTAEFENPDVAEVTPEQIDAVVMQFSPHSELDSDGQNRVIFEYAGKTIAFKGREETPRYPTLEASKPFYLGRSSVLDSVMSQSADEYTRQEWQSQHDRLEQYSAHVQALQEQNESSSEHLLVEQSLYGFIALMERLQPDNPIWSKQKAAIEQNHYDDEALAMIDMITAINSVGMQAKEIHERGMHPVYGEMVVAAAYLGDETAKALATKAAQAQAEQEQQSQSAERVERAAYEPKPIEPELKLEPKDIMVVHSTAYLPRKTADGFEVQTTHDATGLPRATIHTALNHKVASHLQGNWDNSAYIVIAPLNAMVAVDGVPSNLNGADTWWTRNPGETLTFPDATLIAPGPEQTELYVRTNDGELLYKTGNFTEADIQAIGDQFGQDMVERIKALIQEDAAGDMNSVKAQSIIAATLRDALVNWEIAQVRHKPILHQDDDKFMTSADQARITDMARQSDMVIREGLHAGDETDIIETSVMEQKRMSGFRYSDPKVRRVAYASGMMFAGGTAYQFSQRKKASDSGNW